MISLKYLCDQYFILFNDQNVEELKNMFSDDIILEDWNVNVEGKENVINEIKNIFDNVKGIKVLPKKYYEDDKTVCCEINISIDIPEEDLYFDLDEDNNNKTKTDKFQVVDIITFNNFMKIKKIKAYKI